MGKLDIPRTGLGSILHSLFAIAMSQSFQPSLESLAAHRVPEWYDDAKFGIFIHWGLFSIPAFAARVGSISDTFRDHYDIAIALTPYTEWYWNAIKVPESESAKHHPTSGRTRHMRLSATRS